MFRGTKIWEHQEFIKEYMNQYPVIQLDFSEIGFDELDWKVVKDQFVDIMQVALEPHQEHVSEGVFSHMIERTSKVTALKDISKSLKHHHAKNPKKNSAIILLDEYDMPVNEAVYSKCDGAFLKSLQSYLKVLLSSGFKTNKCVIVLFLFVWFCPPFAIYPVVVIVVVFFYGMSFFSLATSHSYVCAYLCVLVLFVCLFVCLLFVCLLFVCLFVWDVCLFVCLFVWMYVCLFICVFGCLFV